MHLESQQNVGKVWTETEYLATNKSSGPELFSQFRAAAVNAEARGP